MKPDEVHMSMGEDAGPMDRLTRLADVARRAVAADPEYGDDVKLIISITGIRPEDGKEGGGFFCHGYEPSDEDKALLDKQPEELQETMAKKVVAADITAVLMEHIEALLTQVTGQNIRLVPVSGMTPVSLTIPHTPN